MVEFLIFGSIFAVILLVVGFGGMAIQNKNEEQHKGELEYDSNSHELKITTRNSYVASNIEIDKEIQGHYNYNPTTITYTSVGVGGVSVGNFDVQKESLSTSSYNTGTYYLNHRKPGYRGVYNPIYSIVLTDSLAESAKRDSRVSKFLYENKLVLRGSGKVPTGAERSALEHYMKQGTLEASSKAMNILLSGAAKSQLTKSECEGIKNWLSGY